jgi:uncharacterized protein YkwD
VRVHRIIVAMFCVLVALASTALVGAAPASAVTTREAAMLAKINNARAAHGLRPLALSGDLSTIARSHSRQMASSTTLFHTASFSSICCWSAIAENVGVAYSVRGLHQALMGSAPHRANILDPRMRAVGVGVVESGGQLWATQIFRKPS